ncbi:hypothetical protein GLOIN_2v200298 [Rhizophagus irregularis DAOM 181602=DAOM 197198]|uniref:Uncharacterized protein n=1 Tax=Rhizophagus irregularis (strain DAOM 181602 / DAOM 197198 / MUCL 43194) TaxID=747089 RepID=A0A2P4PU78_RHIID|nr:hypothetical protein GLOIN_2v200298 [Rhizophagus irregularis DAOM 181602=DAOM 197198]POG68938.1 hypothetical protein GLOIN_2v200298 [Rhizophagus irregularis DAOM 181602=DAOM 197198]GET53978.1 hypothetical protein GLOIN_2v200298 [Rhizophagus irregularis DAOM 181602=DAOM 197198]|eukprot:XP_025175804.1 hypothetical protein GLOIN_2v200298 [Rhizophagus irregularis DAOM 181602=DAOM 197198]
MIADHFLSWSMHHNVTGTCHVPIDEILTFINIYVSVLGLDFIILIYSKFQTSIISLSVIITLLIIIIFS